MSQNYSKGEQLCLKTGKLYAFFIVYRRPLLCSGSSGSATTGDWYAHQPQWPANTGWWCIRDHGLTRNEANWRHCIQHARASSNGPDAAEFPGTHDQPLPRSSAEASVSSGRGAGRLYATRLSTGTCSGSSCSLSTVAATVGRLLSAGGPKSASALFAGCPLSASLSSGRSCSLGTEASQSGSTSAAESNSTEH